VNGVMRAWQVPAGCLSLDQLERIECPVPAPGPGQVRVRVHACSLNYRDQAIVRGQYLGGATTVSGIALSDGVGLVDAVGVGVGDFRPGDRVAGTFFQNWIDGPPRAAGVAAALGHPPAPGMLAEYVVLPESGLVPLARSLSFEQAAALRRRHRLERADGGPGRAGLRRHRAGDGHGRRLAACAADRQGGRRAGDRHLIEQ
jgi:NADPH:quinone reductase-like Zn-dependent oxidoreductase